LAAAPFVVYTDHVSLKYIESLKIKAHNRLARWALALQPYKFTVEHIAGNKLTAANGLSRRPYDEPTNLEDDEELQEDSFIAHIEPDIFDSVSNYDLKHGHRDNRWHVLTIDSKDNSVETPDLLQILPTVEADDV